MKGFVKTSELSTVCGVTPAAVDRWRAAGLPVAKGKGRTVIFDLRAVAAWLVKTGKGDKGVVLLDTDVGTYSGFRSEVAGYIYYGYGRAYHILITSTHISITRQRECIKQLVKLCESQK